MSSILMPAEQNNLRSRGYVAWEDHTIPLPLRFLRTLSSSLLALPRFARDFPGDGGLSAPISYALLSAAPSMICNAIVWARDGDSLSEAVLVVVLLVQPFAHLVYLAMSSLALCGSARMFRVRGLSYRVFLRIVCYASGLNGLIIITLLPWTGILAVLYTAVVCVACIATAAKISVSRALGVYGTTAFLAVCTYVVSLMLAIMGTDS